MPRKNPDRDDLNSYKFYFKDGSTQTFHTPDKLIQMIGKADRGGYHPIVTGEDEFFVNLDMTIWAENITKSPTSDDKME